jgi:hypothetical protein
MDDRFAAPVVEPKPSPASDSPERLWAFFAAAQEKSKATLILDDGIAAGKAYAAFLRSFFDAGPPEARMTGALLSTTYQAVAPQSAIARRGPR